MPVQVEWLLENRIIIVKSHGILTVDDFRNSAREVTRMIGSCDTPCVHIVMDDTLVTEIPRSISSMRHATTWLDHPRLGWAVCYGTEDRFITFVSQMVARVTRIRYRRVADYGEAIALLQAKDGSLPQIVAKRVV